MSHWVTLVITLAGVNLARATGRGFRVALGAVIVLAALVASGGISWINWLPMAASLLLVVGVVMTWHHLVLASNPRWLTSVMMAIAAAETPRGLGFIS